MTWSELLFGIFSGDLGALSVLFVALLPAVLFIAIVRWLFGKRD